MSESKYNCDFIDVISDEMCETELAGNGDQIYYCERKLVKNLPIDQAGNLNADDFVTAVKGKLHQLDMHSDTVEGTGTVEDDQTAGQSQLTGRCDKGEDKFRIVHPDTNWEAGVEYGEQIGLGTRNYKLIKV